MTSRESKRFIIVSGLSGSGKSVALHALEDMGYYCIDNLPIGLLSEFLRQSRETDRSVYEKVAVGIDARNPADDLSRFPELLRDLNIDGATPELLFVEAADDVLITRFSETRRRHPLSSSENSLPDAIAKERGLLAPLSECADLRIDTSRLHVHKLRSLIRDRVAPRSTGTLSLQILSFGFKHGLPPDADFLFDVRCLPNPYWQPHLRDHSGKDPEVMAFLQGFPMVEEMVSDLGQFLDKWIGRFEAENRSYLTIAIGCTGGHHRSVFIVERLFERFQSQRERVSRRHRDV